MFDGNDVVCFGFGEVMYGIYDGCCFWYFGLGDCEWNLVMIFIFRVMMVGWDFVYVFVVFGI